MDECLICSAIKTCEAPENPHQDGEHIPWKLECGDETALGWVEISSKKFTSHNEVVDQAKYILILSENLWKRRRRMYQTELWRLFTSAPIPNEKLSSPPSSIQLLSHRRLPPLDLTGIDFWKCCTNWPAETDFLADCQLIVNWIYASLIQFWTSWSAPSHQGLTQALTSDQTGLTNFVSDCKVIFTTARVVSITKFGVCHNQHRYD